MSDGDPNPQPRPPSGYPPPSVPSAWDAPGRAPDPGRVPPPPPSYSPGYREGGPTYVAPGQGRSTPGLAVAALVVGLVGLFFPNPVTPVLAVVFGALSLGTIRKADGALQGRGLAVAGIILGVVGIVEFALVVAFQDELQDWIDRLREQQQR